MNISIKFCGGCNPKYDRKKFIEEIKKAKSEFEFHYANNYDVYDLLLVICGCTSSCASYKDIKRKATILVNNKSSFKEVLNEINILQSEV